MRKMTVGLGRVPVLVDVSQSPQALTHIGVEFRRGSTQRHTCRRLPGHKHVHEHLRPFRFGGKPIRGFARILVQVVEGVMTIRGPNQFRRGRAQAA